MTTRLYLTDIFKNVAILYFGAMAIGAILPKTLDRTNEAKPLIISVPTDMSNVKLIDNNRTRPAIIITNGGSLKLKYGYRETNVDYAPLKDPGLGQFFDGTFLPKLVMSFSHHDFNRSFITAMGSFAIDCEAIHADTCVNVVANPDGSYGKNSRINLGLVEDCRFGVLATGQENLTIDIDRASQALWVLKDDELGGGHIIYCNESWIGGQSTGTFLRVKGVRARIGSVDGVLKYPSTRVNASPTAKFKGTWDVDYECLSDRNHCGALDAFNSSGVARIKWSHPGGDAQNKVFLGFRVGDQDNFGAPNGNFIVVGEFDHSRAPDQKVRSLALHTTKGRTFLATVKTFGIAKADIYSMINKFGLLETAPPVS